MSELKKQDMMDSVTAYTAAKIKFKHSGYLGVDHKHTEYAKLPKDSRLSSVRIGLEVNLPFF